MGTLDEEERPEITVRGPDGGGDRRIGQIDRVTRNLHPQRLHAHGPERHRTRSVVPGFRRGIQRKEVITLGEALEPGTC